MNYLNYKCDTLSSSPENYTTSCDTVEAEISIAKKVSYTFSSFFLVQVLYNINTMCVNSFAYCLIDNCYQNKRLATCNDGWPNKVGFHKKPLVYYIYTHNVGVFRHAGKVSSQG